MIALAIDVDGQRCVVAGVEDYSLIAFHITLALGEPGTAITDSHAELCVGGLTLPEPDGHRRHFRWQERALTLGSKVTVEIVDSLSPDPPTKRYRSDHEVREDPFTEEEARELRLQAYLELKAEFEHAEG